MRVYVFTDMDRTSEDCYQQDSIEAVLRRVAEGTDTNDLVVGVYLPSKSHGWRGQLLLEWLDPESFHDHAGRKFAFARNFKRPKDLPERFKLIRLAFGLSGKYDHSVVDVYGWRVHLDSFEDHVAYVFAHELHHFRRYHLGMHPGEGEGSATRWGLERAWEAGYSVWGVRIPRRKPQLHKWLQEHFEKLRSLPNGAPLKITYDDHRPRKYQWERATKIKTLRRNSRRLGIRTADGKQWYWPMAWLQSVESQPEGPALTSPKRKYRKRS